MTTPSRPHLIIGSIVVALLSGTLFYGFTIYEFLENASRTRLLMQSSSIVNAVESQLNQTTSSLEALAILVAQYDDLKSGTVQELLNANHSDPLGSVLAISTRDGSSVDRHGLSINTADRTFFIKAIRGEPALSGPYFTGPDRLCSTVLAVPIVRNNEIVGVLRSSNSCETSTRFLENLKYSPDITVYVTSDTGNIVWRSGKLTKNFFDNLRPLVGREYLPELTRMSQDMAMGRNGTLALNVAGEKYFVSYSLLHSGGYVIVCIPRHFGYGNYKEAMVATIIFVGMVVLCFMALILYSNRVKNQLVTRIEGINNDLSMLLDNTPGGICRMKLDSGLTLDFANDGLFELCGRTPPEGDCDIGFVDFLAPNEVRGFMNVLTVSAPSMSATQLAADVPPLSYSTRLMHEDGSFIWVLVRGEFRYVQNQTIFECVITDITELKSAQQIIARQKEDLERQVRDRTCELERQASLLEQVFNALPCCIFYKDLDGRFEGCNRFTTQFFKLRREDLLGAHDSDLFPHSSALVSAFSELQEQARVSGSAELHEMRYVDPQEQEFFFEIHVCTYGPDAHAPLGFIGIIHDITSYKRSEAALTQATQAAVAANEAKSEFLANMSHEIRTPMNGILGLTHLVLGEDEASPAVRDRLRKIDGSARHLMGILNNILDFSKIEASRLVIDYQSCDLEQLLSHVDDVMSGQALGKQLNFYLQKAHDLPETLITDPLRLTQVLLNLCSNAIKFTDEGFVTLSAATEEMDGQPMLRFVVEDTGVGIPEDKISTIFEMFTQVDGSVARRYGGSGLGLTISRHLVELMQGHISAASTLGKGSTFTVLIPLAPSDAVRHEDLAAHAAPVEVDERVLTGKRVLVVEDNLINQEIALELLRSRGMVVDIANNGVESITMAEATEYDVILMDMQMPVMGGIEATQRLRASSVTYLQTVPIIAMTAHATLEDREKSLAAGMNDHINKPLDVAAMYVTLAQWVGASA